MVRMSQFTYSSPWTLSLSFNCVLLAPWLLKNGVMKRTWKDFLDVQSSPRGHINLSMGYGPWCQNTVFRGKKKKVFETLPFKYNMYTWKWINIMHNSVDYHSDCTITTITPLGKCLSNVMAKFLAWARRLIVLATFSRMGDLQEGEVHLRTGTLISISINFL